MTSDTVRLVAVAAVLVLLLVGAIGISWWREEGRPELLEVRVVTATAADPVLRDGLRRLTPDEEFDVAVALRLAERRRGEFWLAPGARLVLDGEEVAHVPGESWPREDRLARVFWSTLESNSLGGELEPDAGPEALAYRSFLVPGMGRGLRTEGRMEAHNDDFMAGGGLANPGGAGTLRFYARVEVVRAMTDMRAEQVATSLGTDDLWDPRLATVQRPFGPDLPAVMPSAGELLLLPGFEHPVGETPGITFAGRATSLEELVAARFVTTSWHLAALAVGLDSSERAALEEVATVELTAGGIAPRLAWGAAVRPRDLLAAGRHWLVLLGDDGDGVLGPQDQVLHSWFRPGRVQTLAAALGEPPRSLSLLRHAGG